MKWVKAIPTRNATDLVVIKFLEDNILSEGVILSHTKFSSQLRKLSQGQRLGQDISYLLARGYVL
jgi:hypothetical protein